MYAENVRLQCFHHLSKFLITIIKTERKSNSLYAMQNAETWMLNATLKDGRKLRIVRSLNYPKAPFNWQTKQNVLVSSDNEAHDRQMLVGRKKHVRFPWKNSRHKFTQYIFQFPTSMTRKFSSITARIAMIHKNNLSCCD